MFLVFKTKYAQGQASIYGTIIYLRLGPSVKRALREGYKNFINFVMRHIPALAFLPPDEIPAAFDELRDNISLEANGIIRWFEDNYVYGRIRRTSRNGNIIRSPPLFPPDFWSVADNIDNAFPRTQNTIEKWHRRWKTVVGLAHVSVFRIIQEIQKEQNHVQHEIESIVRGAPRPTQRRQAYMREMRIQTVFNNRSNRSLMEFLRGIAHNMSL